MSKGIWIATTKTWLWSGAILLNSEWKNKP